MSARNDPGSAATGNARPADCVVTHWADCWRVHQPCAVAKINRLARAVRIQRQELMTIAAAGAGKASVIAAKALRKAHGEL